MAASIRPAHLCLQNFCALFKPYGELNYIRILNREILKHNRRPKRSVTERAITPRLNGSVNNRPTWSNLRLYSQIIGVNSVRSLNIRTGRVTKAFSRGNGFIIGAGILSLLGFKDDKEEDELIYTIKLAVLSIQKGELDKAEQILHLALRIAQEKMEQQGITYIYDMLANVAYQKKDYHKAEKLFIETMKRLIASGKPESDNAVIEISIKLADIYSSLGENKKAEEGFMFSIETVKKKIVELKDEVDKDTHLLLGMASELYAHHLLENSRLNKSRVYYEDALAICRTYNGEKHPQTLVLLNDLGGVCSLLLDYESAMKHLKEAIALGNDTNSEDLPAFYCNLGAVYFKQGNIPEATVMCKKAHMLATKLGNKMAEKDAAACLESIKKKNLEAKIG